MRKRFLLSLLVVLLTTLSIHAYDFQSGDLYYNITSDNTVGVTYQYEYWIESNYQGLTTATIPETVIYNGTTYSVTSIGGDAFKDCSSLTSITLPNSVTSIGGDAFAGCSSLTSITIGNSVRSIGSSAFNSCSSLTSITLPNSVTSIGNYAFSECSSLTSITLPNSVTSIGGSAFQYCSALTSVTLGNSVTSIGDGAFIGCSALSSIVVESGNTMYDSRENCNAIIETASNTLIAGCQSTTIPNSVTSIGKYAFYSCSSLTSLTIPNSVTSIGGSAFYNVPNIVYSGTATGSPWGARSVNGYVEGYLVYADETKTTLLACSAAATGEITIPNSVTSIGERAFMGCYALTSVVWNAKNCAGWNYDTAPFYDIRANITSFTFGEEVETIPSALCYGMTSLTSITLPNSVTSIGNEAFIYCSSLTSIILPNSVTTIGSGAFAECSTLTKLICERHVENITNSAILCCYALDTIIISAQAFDVNEGSWTSMPKNIRYIQLTGGELTDNAFNVILRNYKTLGTLDLAAATNTTLSDEAFKGCYNLQTLVLPAQLTSIPYMAVADCKALQAITIPATVEEIDNSAFENCRSIRSITFEGAAAPENGGANFAPAAATSALWRIGNWAFYNCHQLQHLTIPESVTEIGDAAFYGCTYLEDMTLPSSMRKIGDNTFALCSKLQKIHVRALVPPIICAKTFYDVNRDIPVYVPDEAVADYKADTYWQEFNIVGESNTPMGVENTNSEINAQGVQKRLHNGQVLIIRGDKTYTILGEAL